MIPLLLNDPMVKYMSIKKLEKIIDKTSVLFLSTHKENQYTPNICFYDPVEIITTQNYKAVRDKLNGLEEKLKKNHYIAGYLSYETGYCFEEKFRNNDSSDTPLVWFGIFSKKIELTEPVEKILGWLGTYSKKTNRVENKPKNNITYKEYIKNVNKIKRYISEGDIYQANYTFMTNFSLAGDGFSLFCDLHRQQPVGYSAYINDGARQIISLSPELFFYRDNNDIMVKPMKGTISRGKTVIEDKLQADKLRNSEKDCAENMMIVDLLRNDLGRVCEIGSVDTKSLFDITKYKTLFQMTSTITGVLKKGISWLEIFRNIFPSGSVTGAPKIRAMEIIKQLEKNRRGVYTGSIGYITTEKSLFNVAIRTIVAENGEAQLGIGSAIVADSDPDAEFRECRLKSDFLFKHHSDFDLIETILWEKSNFFLLDLHLDRILKSALYFDFSLNRSELNRRLKEIPNTLDSVRRYKVRLLLNRCGKISIETILIEEDIECSNKKVLFSKHRVSSDNIYLYHKTTARSLYNSELKRYKREGFYDVIFINEKDQVTEGAISNLFIKKGEMFYTPPIDCGLLSGVYRRHFIEKNSLKVREKIIYKDDVLCADEVYLVNSVAKKVKVTIV